MTGFLLDTNVPSELTYPRPSPKVEEWLGKVNDEKLFFSVISLAEICRGIAQASREQEACPATRVARLDVAPVVCGSHLARSPRRSPSGWDDGQGKARQKVGSSESRTL